HISCAQQEIEPLHGSRNKFQFRAVDLRIQVEKKVEELLVLVGLVGLIIVVVGSTVDRYPVPQRALLEAKLIGNQLFWLEIKILVGKSHWRRRVVETTGLDAPVDSAVKQGVLGGCPVKAQLSRPQIRFLIRQITGVRIENPQLRILG